VNDCGDWRKEDHSVHTNIYHQSPLSSRGSRLTGLTWKLATTLVYVCVCVRVCALAGASKSSSSCKPTITKIPLKLRDMHDLWLQLPVQVSDLFILLTYFIY